MQLELVAHRGSSALRAEHTRAAYELAIDQGADALECDVRLTRDGELVCVHDRTVDRTSDGTGRVSDLTTAQLSELDFGGERGVLTMRALLGMAVDRGAGLFIETKHPVRTGGKVEVALIDLLAEFGLNRPRTKAESPVVVMSFSAMAVRRVRALAPGLPTVFLLNRMLPWLRGGVLPSWADHTGPGLSVLRADPDYVARAADRGHDTYCWTVDDPADIRFCADLGVRWLATNDPAATRTVLDAIG
ncbi:glycerophosphodiester phosphodiesterase family protein [Alloactinosynnema sp. L-07]|uniref:glycerophosphodiester phosphodiesterase n=1 Tax=Alloactinosynnema sp. L-07 TaxID=1653480 RepID=UPI001E3F67A8|nr:glycerophosphodiester phosphodiesterase family protein [Alloactinosynnema sp. L-07]